MEQMQYARICVEVVGNDSFPAKIRLNCGNDFEACLARVVEVEVKYHWKPPRCANCKKIGHNATQCRPKGISKPTGGAKPAFPPMLDPLYKITNSGANPSAMNVSWACLPDPTTGPREALAVFMEHKLLDGYPDKDKSQDVASHNTDTTLSIVLQDIAQPKLGDQEGFELDPSAANKYPVVAHLSTATDSHHFLAGNPLHASTLAEVVHKAYFSSEEPSVYSAEFCDSTPNSIIKLSCKYAQDDFGTLAA
ncbi:hypothetical protein Nepgr_025866 [Nepenthes gracilis]|uniref:Uncharacterized protein n=1 Tax=Nepenthes gracilis TaxID=150966 RepID=A0AAD3T721_NEPGR|nr:hypothetical protein Nepgr_025866 [Nepenthes gracilis]